MPEPFTPRVKVDPDRYNTPWRSMSDVDFARAVDSARGRVSIGFKEPNRLQGVDDHGRSLVSDEAARQMTDSLERAGVRIRYRFQGQPTVLAVMDGERAAALRRNSRVDYVEPETFATVSSQVTPIGITGVGAPSGWSLSTGSGVKVMVIDTGHDTTATDLNVSVAMRCDTTYDSRIHDWRDGHGTHVMGTLAALDNSTQVIGVSHGVTLWSANASYDEFTPGRKTRISFDDAACAVNVAKINGVRVVNMSFGAIGGSSTALTNAINDAFDNYNVVFVASAGNDTSGLQYPANLNNVIAVGAVDSTGAHAVFSNTGSALDLVGPGVDVLSTYMAGGDSPCSTGSGVCSGTSMAAPHVAGAAALLAGRYPSWTSAQIKARLLATATDLGSLGFDNTFGYGFLNANAALRMTASVVGVSPANSGTEYEYAVAISGGQSAYTYQWYIDGSPAGTGSSLFYTPGSSDFAVSVTVTDYYGLTAGASKDVTVIVCGDSPLPPCT